MSESDLDVSTTRTLINDLTEKMRADAHQTLSDAEKFFDQKIELAKFTLTGLASLYAVLFAGVATFIDQIHKTPVFDKIVIWVTFTLISLALIRFSTYLAMLPMNRFSITLSNWNRRAEDRSEDLQNIKSRIPEIETSSEYKRGLSEGAARAKWIKEIRHELKEDGSRYLTVLKWGIASLGMLDILVLTAIFYY